MFHFSKFPENVISMGFSPFILFYRQALIFTKKYSQRCPNLIYNFYCNIDPVIGFTIRVPLS